MDKKKILEEAADHILHKELTSVLANERTYAAWTRTALSTFVTGLAVVKLFNDLLPPRVASTIGAALFLCSIAFFSLAAWRYCHVGSRLISERVAGASTKLLTTLSILLATAIVLAALGILMTT